MERGFIKDGEKLSELAIGLELEVSWLRNVAGWGQTQSGQAESGIGVGVA